MFHACFLIHSGFCRTCTGPFFGEGFGKEKKPHVIPMGRCLGHFKEDGSRGLWIELHIYPSI